MSTGVPGSQRRRVAFMAGGVISGTLVLLSAWIGARLLVRGLRLALGAMRFAYATATFRLLRRCPDCKSLIRADARVCRHCGYRRAPRPE